MRDQHAATGQEGDCTGCWGLRGRLSVYAKTAGGSPAAPASAASRAAQWRPPNRIAAGHWGTPHCAPSMHITEVDSQTRKIPGGARVTFGSALSPRRFTCALCPCPQSCEHTRYAECVRECETPAHSRESPCWCMCSARWWVLCSLLAARLNEPSPAG